MGKFRKLSHVFYKCEYHIVFVPKYRKKKLYGEIRSFLGTIFHELASHRSCKILEGHMVQDHVHMIISISPKCSVSEVVGYVKGKSVIAVARKFGGRKRNFNGEKFWVRGYDVSTVGFEVEKIKAYVKHQEQFDSNGFNEDGRF